MPHCGPCQEELRRAGAVDGNLFEVMRLAVERSICDLPAIVRPSGGFVASAVGEASGATSREIIYANEKPSVSTIVGRDCEDAPVGRQPRVPIARAGNLTELFASAIEPG